MGNWQPGLHELCHVEIGCSWIWIADMQCFEWVLLYKKYLKLHCQLWLEISLNPLATQSLFWNWSPHPTVPSMHILYQNDVGLLFHMVPLCLHYFLGTVATTKGRRNRLWSRLQGRRGAESCAHTLFLLWGPRGRLGLWYHHSLSLSQPTGTHNKLFVHTGHWWTKGF